MKESNNFVDYYEILQVSPNACQEVIEAAYRRLMKSHHPDVGGPQDYAKLLNEAYYVLKDPEKRREYDEYRNAYYSTRGSSSDLSVASERESRTSDMASSGASRKSGFRSGWGILLAGVLLLGIIIARAASIYRTASIYERMFAEPNAGQAVALPPARTEAGRPTGREEKLPTKIQVMEAMQLAHRFYDDSFGLVPDNIAEARWRAGLVRIVESFPADWKAGIMVVRYRSARDPFGVHFYPVVKSQDGYLMGEYYLKGVWVKEVTWASIYTEGCGPRFMAEKEPVVIWRTSPIWRSNRDTIWDKTFWISHGYFGDPALVGCDWIPLVK